MVLRRLSVANPHDKGYYSHRYLLWFGEGGPKYLLVYSDCLENALGVCGDWLAEFAPGALISDEEMQSFMEDACKEHDLTLGEFAALGDGDGRVEKIRETAEQDLTYTEAGWMRSWEWGIYFEDPSKTDLICWATGMSRAEYNRRLAVKVAPRLKAELESSAS